MHTRRIFNHFFYLYIFYYYHYFILIPGNVGIQKNEAANRAAKEAFDQEPKNDLTPKPLTAKYIH